MYCIKCGKKNIPSYAFCYNCGTALVQPAESNPASSESGTNPGPSYPLDNPSAPPSSANPPPAAGPTWSPPSGPPYNSAPPPEVFQPPVGGPYGTPAPYEPGWRPPFPYGYPPIPRRGETQHFPVASNGKPFIVLDHPEAFHSYKNKDGKQIYAAFATFQARFLAAMFDTILIFIPLQFVAWLAVFVFDGPLLQRVVEATRSGNQNQFNQELNNALPGWVTLAIFTGHLLYCVLMTWLFGGQTLGKKLLRIKIIRQDGNKPDFYTALTRNLFGYCWGLGAVAVSLGAVGTLLGFFLQIMVLFGFSAAFSNKQKRGWHDRLAETMVVGKNELVQGVNY